MARESHLAIVASAFALAACVSTVSRSDEPAVIAAPTAESREELARAVSTALHGARVTLADDALTRESLLIIERARPRDAKGRPIDGRVLEKPEQFQLVKSGSQCVLIHRRAGERYPLAHTTCRPMK